MHKIIKPLNKNINKKPIDSETITIKCNEKDTLLVKLILRCNL